MATLGWRHVSENYNMLPPVADFAPSDWVMLSNVDERASLAAAFTNYAVAARAVSSLVVDHQRGEPLELAILADRKTLDIVDQHVRRGGRGERKSEGGYEEFE